MNQSENRPVPLNNVPKGLGLVECKDPVGEAVPGPGLHESLRAQTHGALSTPCSLAPDSHLSGEGITWQGRGRGGGGPSHAVVTGPDCPPSPPHSAVVTQGTPSPDCPAPDGFNHYCCL